MMGISGYAYGTEPGSMSPEMNKFYLTFTNETLSDMQMRQIWIERKNNYLARYGIPRQDPLEYMPKLKKYYQGLQNGGSGGTIVSKKWYVICDVVDMIITMKLL